MSQFPKMPQVLLLFVFSNFVVFSQTESEDKTLSPYFLVKSENTDIDQLMPS